MKRSKTEQPGDCYVWARLEVKVSERKKEDEAGITVGIEQIKELLCHRSF